MKNGERDWRDREALELNNPPTVGVFCVTVPVMDDSCREELKRFLGVGQREEIR